MSTHAILTYKNKDDEFVAKYCQYGAYEDYMHELDDADYDDFKEAVDGGSSSEPFDGFYLDEDHCMSLGWDHEMYIREMSDNCPKVFEDFKGVIDYAKDACATYIYFMYDDGKLEIYESFHGSYRLVEDEEEEDEEDA